MRYNRLTDADMNLGPFTLGRLGSWRPLGIDLCSGDDEHPARIGICDRNVIRPPFGNSKPSSSSALAIPQQ